MEVLKVTYLTSSKAKKQTKNPRHTKSPYAARLGN